MASSPHSGRPSLRVHPLAFLRLQPLKVCPLISMFWWMYVSSMHMELVILSWHYAWRPCWKEVWGRPPKPWQMQANAEATIIHQKVVGEGKTAQWSLGCCHLWHQVAATGA